MSENFFARIDEFSRLAASRKTLPREHITTLRHDIAEAGRILAKLKIARDCA